MLSYILRKNVKISYLNMLITECNATMSDLITGKIINQIEDWRYKSLGFMFNVATSEYFCGVALISTSVAISDGSCIPNGTSLSKIQIHFRVYEQNIDRPNYGIRKRMKIPNDNVNIIFIVVSTSTKLWSDIVCQSKKTSIVQ